MSSQVHPACCQGLGFVFPWLSSISLGVHATFSSSVCRLLSGAVSDGAVPASLQHTNFLSFTYRLRSGIARSYGASSRNFLRDIPQQLSPCPHQHLCIFCLPDGSQSDQGEVTALCGLNCVSLMVGDIGASQTSWSFPRSFLSLTTTKSPQGPLPQPATRFVPTWARAYI